ncbi:MAG TPA: cellulase family glycosylhydrolase [Gaiellaceae bacterium]|nr:cellulase family glycosylhydrolase [Gaiellaceae bacterium]
MHRFARIALLASLFALVLPLSALAADRMPVGFQDDPTFRWNGDIETELDKAQAANASIIRATADWRAIAAKRPAQPANSFDPAYNLNDLDDLVRNAQKRGMEVLITIWGTPKWANGGKSPNYLPKKLADLNKFAHALADRYSGRHAGYPYVGRFSVWNEPNLGLFLMPQFDKKGRVISPKLYAKLYKAAWAGIHAGNKTAQVAIGETSNLGRDHPKKGAPVSTAPGTFARLLAQTKGLKFDAYATHPYATRQNLPPTQKVRWPNVTLTQLPRFEKSIDQWFHRKNIPIWITEYGYETKPDKFGVTFKTQAKWMSSVMRTLRADDRVQLFVWFIFRDSKQSLWQSGLFTEAGAMKPSYRTFSALAATIDGLTQTVKAGRAPTVSLEVPKLAYSSEPGSIVGITYRVFDGRKLIAIGQPTAALRFDQTVRFVADFDPVAGRTYSIEMDANDINGNHVVRTYNLTAPGKVTAKKKAHKAPKKH